MSTESSASSGKPEIRKAFIEVRNQLQAEKRFLAYQSHKRSQFQHPPFVPPKLPPDLRYRRRNEIDIIERIQSLPGPPHTHTVVTTIKKRCSTSTPATSTSYGTSTSLQAPNPSTSSSSHPPTSNENVGRVGTKDAMHRTDRSRRTKRREHSAKVRRGMSGSSKKVNADGKGAEGDQELAQNKQSLMAKS
ncbi:hypothetical protein I302_103607 [Kwoniella bestiolae CBS 10118]|uniref:Uncharacterized protein n=1 Tax=Kwoniella bestiolae CBS 10118 TaxID=1296100 RepID=A0A1B9G8X8_9TREE|nr:hypothetical protein I302_02309 [Kwoniella bestiolae CBS 10118]OCF27467.1 hypothetical protein I302_02309 [Kwoniella bestiolae CBS 10118]